MSNARHTLMLVVIWCASCKRCWCHIGSVLMSRRSVLMCWDLWSGVAFRECLVWCVFGMIFLAAAAKFFRIEWSGFVSISSTLYSGDLWVDPAWAIFCGVRELFGCVPSKACWVTCLPSALDMSGIVRTWRCNRTRLKSRCCCFRCVQLDEFCLYDAFVVSALVVDLKFVSKC